MWLSALCVIFIASEVSGLSISWGGDLQVGSKAYVECRTAWTDGYATLTTPTGDPHTATSRSGLRYNMDPVKEEHGGKWTCKTRSAVATINLDIKGSSTRLSARMSYSGPTTVGSTLELDCLITGPDDSTVNWYKNSQSISTPRATKTSVTRGDELHHLLTITRVQSSDEGSYRCEVRNGGSSARASVQVDVQGTGPVVVSTTPPTRPTVTQSSARLSARMSYSGPTSVGSTLELECLITGPPGSTVNWYKNSQRISSPRATKTYVTRGDVLHHFLTITRVQSSDEGRYRCQVSNGGSSARADVQVDVQGTGPGVVSTTPPTRPTVTQSSTRLSARMSYSGPTSVGSTLELECLITGPPGSTVNWYKNSQRISSPRATKTYVTRGDVLHHLLTITRVQSSDEGRYRCQVSNGGSYSRAEVQVNVQGSGPVASSTASPTRPPIISEHVSVRVTSSFVVWQGQPLKVDCRINAPVGSTVTFTKDGAALTQSTGRTLSLDTQPDGKHYIYNVDSAEGSDGGSYRCDVRGPGGSTSWSRTGVFVMPTFNFWGFRG